MKSDKIFTIPQTDGKHIFILTESAQHTEADLPRSFCADFSF